MKVHHRLRSVVRSTVPALPALVGALLLAGCAGLPAAGSRTAPAPQAGPPLETIRPGLRHAEDSLVLDLLLGYRGGDRDTERRALAASQQLEYMLRHGGIKDRGGDARLLTTPGGEKLTLRETVEQLSEALLRTAPGKAWRPNEELARDIQRRRPELSTLVEDADWVLTLSAELEGPLPAADKARLRRLHQRYAARAPHAEIAAEVGALLADVRDDRLRRELKKLANRSWERERRAGTSPSPGSPPTPVPAAPAPSPLPAPVPEAVIPALPAVPPTVEIDSAFPPLDPLPPTTDTIVTPERYCAERRAEAAQAFASARGAADSAAKTRFLRRSLELLDACIARHPDSPEAEKARQNRARVEQELKP